MNKPTKAEIDFASEVLQKVGLFMRTFQQPTPIGFINAAIDQFNLRMILIEEEFLEFLEAKDREEQLDALCDLLYVAAGGFITCGFRMKEFKTFAQAAPFGRAVAEMRREFLVQPCEVGLRNRGSALILTNIRAGQTMFKKFNGAFSAVHDNNMDKAWTEEELKFIPDGGHATKFETKSPRCYAVMNAKKKIIKPPFFKKVDLTPYL